jgi:hypothetical protein
VCGDISPTSDTENSLADTTDLNSCAERRDAQGILPQLIRRLVAVADGIEKIGFRSAEGIQRAGFCEPELYHSGHG